MMVYRHESELSLKPTTGHAGAKIIDESNGAVNGFSMGIAYYGQDEYGKPGIHEDQEGFFVLEGTGKAKVGNEEFAIRPGSAFIAAKGVPHILKKAPESPPVKVFWCHGSV
ncbi:MAG TPA: cupin domain-containing protein [Spirochaetia bacterium]|nr:cupin domain-containing protein [Spirochaetia bacterium]